ncbi:MAG: hypothetical protein AB7E48_01065 [Deferribacterales bacterium]
MWVIGLIVLAAFIAFLVFTPPMKAETAEKLAKDLENNSDNNANKNLSGNFGYDALQNYNETRTNPAYSYLSDNIHYKD